MTTMDVIDEWRAQQERRRAAWKLVIWGMAGAFFGGALVIVTWMRYV